MTLITAHAPAVGCESKMVKTINKPVLEVKVSLKTVSHRQRASSINNPITTINISIPFIRKIPFMSVAKMPTTNNRG